jgi:hypothetical protein
MLLLMMWKKKESDPGGQPHHLLLLLLLLLLLPGKLSSVFEPQIRCIVTQIFKQGNEFNTYGKLIEPY